MADVAVPAPSKRVTAWSVETNPKYTRAWLESLAPLDNLDSARELYQGLYALNRTELEPGPRLELMQLYRGAVRDACEALESALAHASFPLPDKLRRLAQSLCQLHWEMAFGCKLGLQDLSKSWLTPWRRRQIQVLAAERALYHLTEVLLRSYQMYLPYPAGVWRDANALYRLVELHGRHDEQIETGEGTAAVRISVSQRYRQMLMLGAANPYQMPYGECAIVSRFLEKWIGRVRISPPAARSDASGCFIVDATSDAPPAALGRTVPDPANNALRLLDASELVRTLHVFLHRLEKGEPAADLQLGVDCLDSTCHDMLQRLQRAYAQTVTRRHSRIKRHETVMICAGIGALHFFASGQKSFAPTEPVTASTTDGQPAALNVSPPAAIEGDEEYVALDEPAGTDVGAMARASALGPESFRLDRWQVRDVGPQGLLITQDNEPRVRFRVGDVLGIQRTSMPGHWSVGLVRWLRARREKGMEVGVKLIAPDARPASLRPVGENEALTPVLMLSAVEAAQRPASILVMRGAVQIGKNCFLSAINRGTRRVRILDVIEHTNAVEQVIVGNVID